HVPARAPAPARRPGPRALAGSPRGRPLRARPLRRKAAPDPARARRRRDRAPLVLVLQDRLAWTARRLLRAPGGVGSSYRVRGDERLPHALAALSGDRVRVPRSEKHTSELQSR